MPFEYYISYKTFDSEEFVPLTFWSRPLFEEEKLDETLDMGNIALNGALLQEIPPFSVIRIEIQKEGDIIDTLYFSTTDNPLTVQTTTL